MITQHEILDQILNHYQTKIGRDFTGYKNHCYRVLNIYVWLAQQKMTVSQAEIDQAAIALAFHDLGIWTDKTLDYLPPSEREAQQYCNQYPDLDRQLIMAMINEHHKISAYTGDKRVEFFRQADLVDFSLGVFRFDLDKATLQQLNQQFPNAGFHQLLTILATKNLFKHPFKPAPMMKW